MQLKPSSIPTNVIITVIFIGLSTSNLLLEAEIEIWPFRGAQNSKILHNSKSKQLGLLKPLFVPTNVMTAVIFMWLLNS